MVLVRAGALAGVGRAMLVLAAVGARGVPEVVPLGAAGACSDPRQRFSHQRYPADIQSHTAPQFHRPGHIEPPWASGRVTFGLTTHPQKNEEEKS